jgi:REP element-mobilizing transposase RayT
MSRALRLEFPGAIWHVTSRGNERRPIFRDDADRTTFTQFLADTVGVHEWTLHAWVLMDNHYHLLVETPRAPSLSRGVKRLNESWAQAFNTRYERVGHLFQGRFKSILVERESHLLELVRYIVLNPVRSGAVRYAGDWKWSNYRATGGLERAPAWLEVDWTLSQFGSGGRASAQAGYREFVADGRGASYNPREAIVGQIYLGSEEFRSRMQLLVDQKQRSSEFPRVQREVAPTALEAVAEAVASVFGLQSRDELSRKSQKPHRRAFVHLARTLTPARTAAIARFLAVSERSVEIMARASEHEAATNHAYLASLDAVGAQLGRSPGHDPQGVGQMTRGRRKRPGSSGFQV